MNILIIEDSKSVAHIIDAVLMSNGFMTKIIRSKDFKLDLFKNNLFEIVICNTSTQEGSVRMIKDIRRESNRILLLGISTKSTWKEKVEFLNNGGDDVLDYPFPMQELLARISALLRRPKQSDRGIIRMNDIEVDTDGKHVSIGKKDLPLRRREYNLLEYMIRNKNRTISRSELLDHVWDYRRATGSNTVDVHVKRLRDKMKDRDLIETVHGFGYMVRDRGRRKYKKSK
ncbi:response regulator transcription factor [Candidatus Dojkabacteria bacterium]|jgi:DNA-binding response OmpR family regulator|nr:response regulator transcription factor [Candidatus Dojkabacteria bacterium]